MCVFFMPFLVAVPVLRAAKQNSPMSRLLLVFLFLSCEKNFYLILSLSINGAFCGRSLEGFEAGQRRRNAPQVDLTFLPELGVGGEWGTLISLSHRANDPRYNTH